METILLYYIPDHKTPELSALAKFSQNLPAINYKLDSFSRTFLFRKKKVFCCQQNGVNFPHTKSSGSSHRPPWAWVVVGEDFLTLHAKPRTGNTQQRRLRARVTSLCTKAWGTRQEEERDSIHREIASTEIKTHCSSPGPPTRLGMNCFLGATLTPGTCYFSTPVNDPCLSILLHVC